MQWILTNSYSPVPTATIKEWNIFLSPKVPSCPFVAKSLSTFLVRKHLLLCSFPYKFTFSRMLCKCNHSVCSILGLTFFTYHNVFQIYSYCYMYQQFILFYCSVIFHRRDIPPHLKKILSIMMDIWIISSLGQSWIKHPRKCLCVGICFHSFWVNI